MSERPYLPALLVWHDATGDAAVQRVLRVLQGAGRTAVGCAAADFAADIAAPALEGVGAYEAFLVIHVVGAFEDPGLSVEDRGTDPAGAVLAELTRVAEGFRARWPGKARIDQWVIHTVGQRLDDAERDVVSRLVSAGDATLRGVIVSASATHASVTHDDAQQAGFAADVVLALIGSDLEEKLADVTSMVWFVGATSVTYARSRVAEVVSALYARRLLDAGLLATPPTSDPAYGVGEAWVQDLDPAGPRERDLLLDSTSGGVLHSALRVRTVDWAKVPLASWSAVLTTARSMLALERFPEVETSLEANRRRRVAELETAVIDEAFEHLEGGTGLESVLSFLRGVQAALKEAADEITAPPSAVDPAAIDRDVERLRHLTRWLPFGPAVALRVFALALGVLVVVGVLTGPSGLAALDWAAEPWARLAGVAVLVLGFLAYQRQVGLTLRVRDRLRAQIEDEASARLERLVAEARRRTLLEVRAWIGERPPWLDDGEPPVRQVTAPTLAEWFAWLIVESRRVRDALDDGVDGGGAAAVASPYAVDLPTAPLLSPESLAADLLREEPNLRDAARSFAREVRPLCSSEAMVVLAADDLGVHWRGWLADRMGPGVWQDLGDLLSERPSVRDGARAVLERNTTPAIPTKYGRPEVGTRHYLVVPGGKTGAIYRHLFSRDVDLSRIPRPLVSDSLTAVLECRLPDVSLMVHLYGVSSGDLRDGDVAHDGDPDRSGVIR